MALSRRKPVGYPEISFLSFDVLALLTRILDPPRHSPHADALQLLALLPVVALRRLALSEDLGFRGRKVLLIAPFSQAGPLQSLGSGQTQGRLWIDGALG
jgi:hypothetical protein